jgi:hypothetical protein
MRGPARGRRSENRHLCVGERAKLDEFTPIDFAARWHSVASLV